MKQFRGLLGLSTRPSLVFCEAKAIRSFMSLIVRRHDGSTKRDAFLMFSSFVSAIHSHLAIINYPNIGIPINYPWSPNMSAIELRNCESSYSLTKSPSTGLQGSARRRLLLRMRLMVRRLRIHSFQSLPGRGIQRVWRWLMALAPQNQHRPGMMSIWLGPWVGT